MVMLIEQQFSLLKMAVNDLTPMQKAWVGGYISGLSIADGEGHSIPLVQPGIAELTSSQSQELPEASIQTTILYGSQTGNSKGVAEKLEQLLRDGGYDAQLKSLRDYRPQQLKKEQRVIFVISTHGNGEPPDDAVSFFQFINGKRAPSLENVEFAVLALGDSSYEEYCHTGIELDQRLEALGGSRWLSRIDCDVDFQDDANAWNQQVVSKFQADKKSTSPVQPQQQLVSNAATQATVGTAESPYVAEVLAITPLTDLDSDKDVLHVEFSLEDSGIHYQPGDILAVHVSNDPQLVKEVLQQVGLSGSEQVTIKSNTLDLNTVLLEHRELTLVTRKQLSAYAELIQNQELENLAADKTALVDWLEGADWLDVLSASPKHLDAQVFVDLLRPLQPRQYSIASSLEAHPEEVHLVVKRVEYEHQDRQHLGVASNWLAGVQEGDTAKIYIKPNPNFKLPQSPDTKVIMIGPGTGVAPFRSFMAERDAQGIEGNSWLFFGEQHFRSEFLYQSEWLNYLKSGSLEKMSVAFSRDQPEKIYVQQRILEEAETVWQWLKEGAHLYVCGDMTHMAKDVHAALIQVGIQHGGKTQEESEQWLSQMIVDKKYQRDIY